MNKPIFENEEEKDNFLEAVLPDSIVISWEVADNINRRIKEKGYIKQSPLEEAKIGYEKIKYGTEGIYSAIDYYVNLLEKEIECKS